MQNCDKIVWMKSRTIKICKRDILGACIKTAIEILMKIVFVVVTAFIPSGHISHTADYWRWHQTQTEGLCPDNQGIWEVSKDERFWWQIFSSQNFVFISWFPSCFLFISAIQELTMIPVSSCIINTSIWQTND